MSGLTFTEEERDDLRWKINRLQYLIRKGPSSYEENEQVFMYHANVDNQWRWDLLKTPSFKGPNRRKGNRRAT